MNVASIILKKKTVYLLNWLRIRKSFILPLLIASSMLLWRCIFLIYIIFFISNELLASQVYWQQSLSNFAFFTKSLFLLQFSRIISQCTEFQVGIFCACFVSLNTKYLTLLSSCLQGFWGETICNFIFAPLEVRNPFISSIGKLSSGFFLCIWFSVV